MYKDVNSYSDIETEFFNKISFVKDGGLDLIELHTWFVSKETLHL